MFRVVLGFLLGVIAAKNTQEMQFPVFAAVLVAFIGGCYITYRFGKRDINSAVATAVAVATSKAKAEAEASAAAIANAAIQFHLHQGELTPRMTYELSDTAVEQIRNTAAIATQEGESDYARSSVKS